MLYAVVNPDGTYAGVPCFSWDGARELANQKDGRIIYQLKFDPMQVYNMTEEEINKRYI